MSLNIKSESAHRLAKQLAEARGSTLTDAVTSALSESLRATRGQTGGVEALLDEVRQVQALVAELPDRDTGTADDVLGYDERGMPQ